MQGGILLRSNRLVPEVRVLAVALAAEGHRTRARLRALLSRMLQLVPLLGADGRQRGAALLHPTLTTARSRAVRPRFVATSRIGTFNF